MIMSVNQRKKDFAVEYRRENKTLVSCVDGYAGDSWDMLAYKKISSRRVFYRDGDMLDIKITIPARGVSLSLRDRRTLERKIEKHLQDCKGRFFPASHISDIRVALFMEVL